MDLRTGPPTAGRDQVTRREQAFEDLLEEIRGCALCAEHLPLGPRPVVRAHVDAPILIVGQAPGRRVHESGIPFDDPSGDRLREWLGVDSTTFYDPRKFAIAPMGFCYPGTGKSGDLPPRPECAVTWRRRLLDPLDRVKLTIILGSYAIAWHIGGPRQSLTETVRNWERYWPERLVLPHPSPRNIRWFKTNPWMERDVIPALQARVRDVLD